MGMNYWQRLWQHWRKDLSLRLLALAAAVALWLYVSSEPATEKGTTAFVQAIPTVQGVAPDLKVSQLPNVTIELQGPREELAKIKPEGLLYVDLSGLESGTHLVRVRRKIPGAVRAVSTSPAHVKVKLLRLTQIGIPVSVEVPGAVAADTLATPKQVVVKGTGEELEKVHKAIVRAEDASGTGVVLVLDEQGRALPLEVEPALVKYQVKLSQPVASKMVPVAQVENVTFTPHQVRLWGREDELAEIQEVLTEPLPQEKEGQVPIVVPQGVYEVEPESVHFISE
jgi:YbbR domain-containing protein